jgi:hypothetical protein
MAMRIARPAMPTINHQAILAASVPNVIIPSDGRMLSSTMTAGRIVRLATMATALGSTTADNVLSAITLAIGMMQMTMTKEVAEAVMTMMAAMAVVVAMTMMMTKPGGLGNLLAASLYWTSALNQGLVS